jgi:branched-chain amino acid transport system substrate-binding protein
MQKKLLAIIVVVIVIVAAVAAIQLTNQPPSPDARPIKVGLVAPLSTSIGQDMSKAAQLAVQEINDAGGVYVSAWHTKVNITLVNADTKTDGVPDDAVTAVTTAVETDQVDLLIGGYGSAATLADEKVAIDNKVPFIITGASNQLVTRRGPQGNYGDKGPTGTYSLPDAEGVSYMFHYCTTTYDYAKTVVDFFAQEMKPLVAADRNFSLALLFRNDAFGKAVAESTRYWIQNESLPITLVVDRGVDPATTNYQTDLTVVKQANPDAVFVVDNPDKTPLVISQGWNDVGLKTVYIAVENNQDPVYFQLLEQQLGSSAAGQLLESKLDPFMSPSYSDDVGAYSEKFNAVYGVMPGMMGADTYDAFYIAKNAIERAGSLDKAAVRQAIEETNMDQMLILTQSGKIQFSTGVNYHEISPVTFIEQLKWDTATNKLSSQIVWAPDFSGVNNLKQADFTLPDDYQPGQ